MYVYVYAYVYVYMHTYMPMPMPMTSSCNCHALQSFRVKPCMDRSVAIGATSGSLSALILRLVSELSSSAGAPFECPICPELDFSHLIGDLDPFSLLVGLCLGIAVGPTFDLLHLIRHTWRVWIRSRLQQLARESGEPLYKLA